MKKSNFSPIFLILGLTSLFSTAGIAYLVIEKPNTKSLNSHQTMLMSKVNKTATKDLYIASHRNTDRYLFEKKSSKLSNNAIMYIAFKTN